MAIIEKINTRGSSNTSTLSGNIVIDDGAGELRIYKNVNGNQVLVNRISESGNDYYDTNGNLRITTGIDTNTGYIRQLYKDSNNYSRIIIGQSPADGEPIIAVTTSGNDVEEELIS